MKLIFGALTIVAVVMVLLAGSGVSWLTSSTLEKAKQESVKALATGLAYSVSSQMQLLEKTVEQIAVDEDVIAAIESGDSALIEKTATKVQKFLPVALKVRLLPTSINAIDEREKPVMGYADLEMVKKTVTGKQISIIQGEGDDRHLAVTAGIKKGDQVIGVVLASLKFDFLTDILTKAPINGNFIEISQDSVVLGSGGDPAIKKDNPERVSISDSPWQISYVAASAHSLADVGVAFGLIMGFAVLTCVAMFFGYTYITGLLKKDQNTVLEAVKNLMMGKELHAGEVKLSEMQVIISTLVQFKRILDNKSGKSDEPRHVPKDITLDELEDFVDDEKPSLVQSVSTFLKKKK